MIEKWIREIKEQTDPKELGMILAHNGLVRGTSKVGEPVTKMRLSFDEAKLQNLLDRFKDREGIVKIKVWINQGELNIGDDIMLLLEFYKNVRKLSDIEDFLDTLERLYSLGPSIGTLANQIPKQD